MSTLRTLFPATTFLIVFAAVSPVEAGDKDLPLVPNLDKESPPTEDQSLRQTIRSFDSIIDLAQTTRSHALEDNMAYNSERQGTVREQLKVRGQRAQRLDNIVALQYDRIRRQFPDGIPEEYHPMIRKLQRQHESMRRQIENENTDLRGELVDIGDRLTEATIEREVASIQSDLVEPYRSGWVLDQLEGTRKEKPRVEESFNYLDDLAQRRIDQQVRAIVPIQIISVSEPVMDCLVVYGCE
ncbi:MAG: hypothetical protein ACYTHJ_06660 [Planctomycetota bacterium]|jgi:hypothetical protein